jgi:hypothetical protein
MIFTEMKPNDFFTVRGHCLPQITQIAASDLAGTRKFSQYALPTEPISAGARLVTGLSVDGDRL